MVAWRRGPNDPRGTPAGNAPGCWPRNAGSPGDGGDTRGPRGGPRGSRPPDGGWGRGQSLRDGGRSPDTPTACTRPTRPVHRPPPRAGCDGHGLAGRPSSSRRRARGAAAWRGADRRMEASRNWRSPDRGGPPGRRSEPPEIGMRPGWPPVRRTGPGPRGLEGWAARRSCHRCNYAVHVAPALATVNSYLQSRAFHSCL